MATKLTKEIIDAATYEGDGKSRFIIWDKTVPNLGLRVFPSGTKSFILFFRNERGNQRLMTLGRYGVLTLKQARDQARVNLGTLVKGTDPLDRRQKVRTDATTVRTMAERYLQEHAIPKKKPGSVAEDERLLKRHILPRFGKVAIADLTTSQVNKAHAALRETPIEGNRMLALLSRICSLAEAWGYRPNGSNPCGPIQRFRENKRERYLAASEIQRLGAALREAEEQATEMPSAINAIRLLLLTGCRKSEILALQWRHVDLERGFLWLPDSKTGKRAVPLGPSAMDFIGELPRHYENPYVLPGRGNKAHFKSLAKPWQRICEAAGLEDLRIHDLRHSFASVGAGEGISLTILGKLLGHKNATTTARYSHLAEDPVRQAARQITEQISQHLERPGGPHDANDGPLEKGE